MRPVGGITRTADCPGAAGLASLRRRAMGVSELQRERQHTTADSLNSWWEHQTSSTL
ncbi:MAG TPA: hypothetical protein VI136_21215 [Verrucomicrobiae bacterium]